MDVNELLELAVKETDNVLNGEEIGRASCRERV